MIYGRNDCTRQGAVLPKHEKIAWEGVGIVRMTIMRRRKGGVAMKREWIRVLGLAMVLGVWVAAGCSDDDDDAGEETAVVRSPIPSTGWRR